MRLLLMLLFAGKLAAAEPAKPRHDPSDQPFRRAPMAESSRSIVFNLSSNLHLAFDTELCRVHTVWLGKPLNLWGPPYSHAKSPFICDYEGKAVLTFPQLPSWSETAAKFLEINTADSTSLVVYRAGSARVRETFSGGTDHEEWQVTRQFTFEEGSDLSLELMLFSAPEAIADVSGARVHIQASNRNFSMTLKGPANWQVRKEAAKYHAELITEEGTEKGNPSVAHDGQETRVYLQFPAPKKGTAVSVRFANTSRDLPIGESPAKTVKIFGPGVPVRPHSGDDYYKIEHFPLPAEAELLITGLDVLPNGDLLVCTWLGEVFVVQGATGRPDQAQYKRIARGLNEPLGIAVRNGEIYVVQKGELTRLVDSNSDGEIDRFQCVSADWGYSGNYHSYSFGPVITPENDLFVFVTGQRGRSDLMYQGWALRINQDGSQTPWCDGLRVPHGFGIYKDDLFVTDNQGNWVGACKLNQIIPGHFYGFPSSRPSPTGARPPESVTPPALWFPRSLSPSTSGFDTISDDRFGPFQGQLMIGDFQNAIVMRACLQKFHGRWQGAVFPFARGFLSGVNRVKMNPVDGKLYVGGGKRTWSTAAPAEASLDRVSFTGKLPFEVREVSAEPDGFTLRFTQSVNREVASDVENYVVKQFSYRYHADYGSPEFDHEGKPGATTLDITSARVHASGEAVRLIIPKLKTGFVTAFQLAVSSAADEDLRQDTFYYTLNYQPTSDETR